jgi:mRNA interferase MazF
MVSKRSYHPARGDVIEMSFYPAAGREIAKRRPAIVLSPLPYNRRSGLCLAVPTSTDLTPGPLWIPMPAGYLPRPSLILCDYIKSFDYRERSATFINRVSEDVVNEILNTLLDLLDPMPGRS